MLDGIVAGTTGDRVTVDLDFAKVEVISPNATAAVGDTVSFSVRSELLRLIEPDRAVDGAWQAVQATYLETIYLGLTTSHLVSLPDGNEVVARMMSDERGNGQLEVGQAVTVGWPTERARLHVD